MSGMLKTVKNVEDEAGRGVRSLENTIDSIEADLAEFLSDNPPKTDAGPEDLIRSTKVSPSLSLSLTLSLSLSLPPSLSLSLSLPLSLSHLPLSLSHTLSLSIPHSPSLTGYHTGFSQVCGSW